MATLADQRLIKIGWSKSANHNWFVAGVNGLLQGWMGFQQMGQKSWAGSAPTRLRPISTIAFCTTCQLLTPQLRRYSDPPQDFIYRSPSNAVQTKCNP